MDEINNKIISESNNNNGNIQNELNYNKNQLDINNHEDIENNYEIKQFNNLSNNSNIINNNISNKKKNKH